MLESRHADLREQNLIRQGKGHFHVSGMGHEALAAVSIQMEPDDYIVSYYRDRGLVLGRGMTTRQLGLEYFAKRNTGSGGRQMPSHYSDADLHIWSVPTPTGSQLLPACGIAWGIKLDGKKNVVVTTIGDAATRQGDFFEAICFAKEKKLPVLFLVEDNAYGISMPTRKTNPLALDVLQPRTTGARSRGQDVQQVYDATAEAFEKIRAGGGPFFFWIKMERLSSHTSSDDQKLYRSERGTARTWKSAIRLTCWKDQLIEEGVFYAEEFAELDSEIKERVRREYAEAEKAEDPSPNELLANVTKPPPKIDKEILPPGQISDRRHREQDLARGSGGRSAANYFRRRHRRSKRRRVSPDAETFELNSRSRFSIRPSRNRPFSASPADWLLTGKRPVFEVQFIDFIYPGFNQLVTNISTFALAIIWQLEMSGRDLCAVWRVSARRKFVAQPGKRIGARPLSRSKRRDSQHASGRRRIALDGDARRGPGDFSNSKAFALGRTRIPEPIRAVPLGQGASSAPTAPTSQWSRGETQSKNLSKRLRKSTMKSVSSCSICARSFRGTRLRLKNQCAKRAGWLWCRRTRRIAASGR